MEMNEAFFYDVSIDDETAEKEIITPEIAGKILSENVEQQRQQLVSHTKKIALAITNKAFISNGSSIKISKEGKLLDGQHRLRAVILSGIPIKTWVIRGMAEDAFTHMDDTDFQRVRKLYDFLSVRGYQDTRLLAPVVNNFVMICRKDFNIGRHAALSKKLTNEQALQVLINHPQIINSLSYSRQERINRLVGKALSSAIYYAFSTIDSEKAYIFFDALNSKKSNEPVILLRKMLEDLRTKDVNESSVTNPVVKHNLIIDAFNLYLGGIKVKDLNLDGINTHSIEGFKYYCSTTDIPKAKI